MNHIYILLCVSCDWEKNSKLCRCWPSVTGEVSLLKGLWYLLVASHWWACTMKSTGQGTLGPNECWCEQFSGEDAVQDFVSSKNSSTKTCSLQASLHSWNIQPQLQNLPSLPGGLLQSNHESWLAFLLILEGVLWYISQSSRTCIPNWGNGYLQTTYYIGNNIGANQSARQLLRGSHSCCWCLRKY